MDGSASGGGRPRRRRLARSAEFERVYRRGRSKANRFLVLYAFPREDGDDEGARLGLSVSRRVGGAVDRTRVKRVLREAFWQEADRLPDGADYVVVARPDAKALAEREGTGGVRRVLGELVESMGGSPATRADTPPPAESPTPADAATPTEGGDPAGAPPPADAPAPSVAPPPDEAPRPEEDT